MLFLACVTTQIFHGHNYELIVSVTGEINKETGFVIDIKNLKEIIKAEVEKHFRSQEP